MLVYNNPQTEKHGNSDLTFICSHIKQRAHTTNIYRHLLKHSKSKRNKPNLQFHLTLAMDWLTKLQLLHNSIGQLAL